MDGRAVVVVLSSLLQAQKADADGDVEGEDDSDHLAN